MPAASITRKVSADRETKSVSAETTFDRDIADFRALERILWAQTEEVSARLKEKALAGATVTLKLKTADFQHPHPRPFVRLADAARRQDFRRRARACSNAKPTARNSACSASA